MNYAVSSCLNGWPTAFSTASLSMMSLQHAFNYSRIFDREVSMPSEEQSKYS